jgi:hypothetical protein
MNTFVSPFDKLRFKLMQWGCISAGLIIAVFTLWQYHAGALGVGLIIALAWAEFCMLTVGFVTWYVRYYWSDAFVRKIARQIVTQRDPEYPARVMAMHPRHAEIRIEIGRQGKELGRLTSQ